jgi:MFS family permease
VAAGELTAPRAVPLRRNRDFLWMWSGQAVSVLGSQISLIAYPLLVLAITGSAAEAGIAGFAGGLPYLLFPLLAGGVADRWNRKRIMIFCDAVRLAALASIAAAGLLGRLTFPQILVAAFTEGTGFVFFSLAQRAALPMIVTPGQRAAAIAQGEARTYGAALAGPPLGGILFGISRFLPFGADAISYIASLTTLPRIRATLQPVRHTGKSGQARLRHAIAEGLAVTWRQPFLRAATACSAAVNLVLQAMTLALIVLAKDHGASPQMVGIIIGGKGIGGLAGASAAPYVQRRVSAGKVIIGSMWVLGAALLAAAQPWNPLWLCPIVTLVGFAAPLWNVAVQTHRLKLIPGDLIGRVSSVSLQVGWGLMPFGSLAAGYLLQAVGPVSAMLVLASTMALTAAAATAAPAIRRTAASA